MKSFLLNLRVRNKLIALGAIAVGGILLLQGLSLSTFDKELLSTKKTELQHLTENAYSLIEQQQALVEAGIKGRAEAEKAAFEAIAALRYGSNDYFFIIDGDYRMRMHPMKPDLVGRELTAIADAKGDRFFGRLVDNARREGSSLTRYYWSRPNSEAPVPKLSYAKFHPGWDLVVATGVYVDDLDAIFWREVRTNATLGGLVLLAVVILTTLISRSINGPLSRLQATMEQACENRDLRLRADLKTEDELGRMSRAFDSMMVTFNGLVLEITAATSQVAGAANELSATTLQTSQGMEEQKRETLQVAAAVNQMNATVHEVANNVGKAADASTEGARSVSHGQAIMDQTVKAVTQLAERLAKSTELTRTLEQESANINTILEVINGVAEQTNLLALNAAIEAARAGEQGRGFAVVADEVRTLAQRTSESTAQIKAVIEQLQNGTAAAVSAMQESSEEAERTSGFADEAGQALQQISTSIEQIDGMTVQIASASEEQSAVADEINQNIEQISRVTEESSEAVSQVARASEELAHLAEHLQELSHRFSVTEEAG
ncbi:methyl-accepting chemotaxis protein [Motiliproteus sp. SC1-56]|uniref:methyl-accepting chemotaxis protein n=1 Tax=Motiliproteus sp. SC1-56 TaxID=2799565 RepID=UPI001A8E6A20|nr:methyl-accepting chemotaxis protein [Motiliproteus sp. SC1-56]